MPEHEFMCTYTCMDLSMYVFVYNTCRYIYMSVCVCAHVIAAIGTSVRELHFFLVLLVTYTQMHTDSQLHHQNPSPIHVHVV